MRDDEACRIADEPFVDNPWEDDEDYVDDYEDYVDDDDE